MPLPSPWDAELRSAATPSRRIRTGPPSVRPTAEAAGDRLAVVWRAGRRADDRPVVTLRGLHSENGSQASTGSLEPAERSRVPRSVRSRILRSDHDLGRSDRAMVIARVDGRGVLVLTAGRPMSLIPAFLRPPALRIGARTRGDRGNTP
ncbi:hypothetical protein AKJ08_3233 [Vulgatibacter incomptus]|uniref:Uncharacterized protein n=1 Tax=Vulgatibacter incomptus TaxID=1391653 RepID=A0A0K1PHG9_9BACT|nr:hypothetical protein AKJ08_3233 [Vulgatibacter incomptus]